MPLKIKLKEILINNVASSNLIPGKLRINIYNFCGMRINNKAIWPGCFISGTNLTIGEGSWVNSKCHFDNDIAKIEIGENCGIAMGVLFCTSSHEIGNEGKRAGKDIKKDISIGDGSWLGARSIILPGVTVGTGCIIAAGSIVTKDCEPNGLYAGNPAKRIKDLTVENFNENIELNSY